MCPNSLRGLYAVTPENQDILELLTQVEQALQGGATLVQYRNKQLQNPHRYQQAIALLQLCRAYQVPLLINDDVELVVAIAADGVHLGRDDLHLALARQRLGPTAIIGVSCYNQLELAYAALQAGIDYVAFGSFFSSTTKPLAVPATLELLTQAKKSIALPIVAIGGITSENGGQLIKAGADMLAVVGSLFGSDNICATARHFTNLFATTID